MLSLLSKIDCCAVQGTKGKLVIRKIEAIQVGIFEPRCEKTGLRDFRPGPTQTGLYSHRRWLEACNFGAR